MIKVTDETFENFKNSTKKNKILKLGAKWCGPCISSLPACSELAQELKKSNYI